MTNEQIIAAFDIVLLTVGLTAAVLSRREAPHAGLRIYVLSAGLTLLAIVHGIETYMSVSGFGIDTIELTHRALVLSGFICLLMGIRITLASIRAASLKEKHLLADVVRAGESNRIKNEFVAFASHEIKGPLTAIQGFGELLQTSQQLSTKELEYVDAVRSESARLLRLVSNLLDSAKLDLGVMEVSREPVDLDDLLAAISRSYRLRSAAHYIEVDSESLGSGKLKVVGDPDHLAQALGNLLDNAIKYSPGGGLIRVTSGYRDHNVEISVIDRGVGISPEHTQQIFAKFQRDPANASLFPGTGIGLYITRQLVELMGGTIRVQSAPNQGTTFTIVLPTVEALPRAA